jgi:hypothetical protein
MSGYGTVYIARQHPPECHCLVTLERIHDFLLIRVVKLVG